MLLNRCACALTCMCPALHVPCLACALPCMCPAIHVPCLPCALSCMCPALHVPFLACALTQYSSDSPQGALCFQPGCSKYRKACSTCSICCLLLKVQLSIRVVQLDIPTGSSTAAGSMVLTAVSLLLQVVAHNDGQPHHIHRAVSHLQHSLLHSFAKSFARPFLVSLLILPFLPSLCHVIPSLNSVFVIVFIYSIHVFC